MKTITRSCLGSILLLSFVTIGYGQKSLGVQNQSMVNELPTFSSDQEKTNWIQEHPEIYGQHTTGNAVIYNSIQAEPVRKKVVTREKVIIISNDSSFPVYIETGNKQSDEEKYAAKKAQWILGNKAKYEKMYAAKLTKNNKSIREEEQGTFNNSKN